MIEQAKLLYTIEEFREKNVQISSLVTSNPWLAIADFLIKVRTSKKKGLVCEILPIVKTRKIMHQVIFISAFLRNKDGDIVREVSISTKAVQDIENKFDKSKTNDYYLSESYVYAVKGLVRHIKAYKSDNIAGILTLAVFAAIDDNHRFWLTYTPAEMSDSLRLDGLKDIKANF